MTTRRPALAARLRTTALAAVLAASGFAVTATPATAPATSGSSPFEGIVQVADELFAPRAALAAFCASNAAFTGRLTASASSTTAVSRITDPDLYAYISDVDAAWSCTAYLRYSGVAWNTTASAGRFDWGNLINSTSVSCNYVPGSTDFIKANSTTDCPDTDAEYALMATLSAERVYQADVNHNTIGDFSYVHADCGTYYSGTVAGEPIQGDETTPESFAGSNVGNRPGANCDALTLDSTGTSQTITYDKTAPTGTSVSVNTGAAYTTATSVTLATAAADAVAGVAQMQFSNDNVAWSAPGAYATSASWTLTAGDGTKTVYARYLDANGNQSPSVSDTIVLDTTPPTGSVSISAGATYAASPGVTLTVSATDTLSPPVSQMRFSNDGSAWTTYPYATSHAWTLATGADGTRTVFAQFQNSAGSWSTGTGIKDTILLDASPAIPNPPDVTCAGTGVWQPAVNGVCYFRPSAAATLTVTGSATDAVSGVAHVRFQALSPTTSWTPTPALPNQDTASPYTEALGFTAATATSTIDVIARNGAGTDGAARHVSLTADTEGPRTTWTAPLGTTRQPSDTLSVSWTEADYDGPGSSTAGAGLLSRSLKEQTRGIDTAGACTGTWTDSGRTWTVASPVAVTGLRVNTCYQYLATLADRVGNVLVSAASGTVIRDTTANLGRQPQHRFEAFDLGAGDELAVNVANGNLVLSHPIVSLPIRGSTVSIGLAYNSQDGSSVGIGPGWRLNVQRRLALNADGTVTFTDAAGSRHRFTSPVTVNGVTTYSRPPELYATLVKDTGQAVEFTLTSRDQSTDTFDIVGAEGLLTREQDRFGNGVTLAYVGGTNRISTITDTAASPNRSIDFGYDTSSRLVSITDWAYLLDGVVQSDATGTRGATRLFYDTSSNLAGWADPLNASATCPTGGSHVTCLTLTGGVVTRISKTQTVEGITGSALGTTARTVQTDIAYTGSDVTAVKDAEQVDAGGTGTVFSHPSPGQTQVVRPGTPASTTRYTLASPNDALARVTSVKRLLGSSTWIEERTAYDATHPIEPASVTANYGAQLSTPARTTSYTYVAGSMGLVSRTTEPLTASANRTTDSTYNANNDVTQTITALDGSASVRTINRSCYDPSCTTTGAGLALLRTISNHVDGTAGNGAASVEDVTLTYETDAFGQRTRETRANYDAAGTLLDAAATGWTYDDLGNQTAEIRNYADGTVSTPGDDITPSATSGARTDLTTAFGYDTAGNRISTADPRRAIEAAKGTTLAGDDFVDRATFDALGQQLADRTPTTPGVSITQKTATSTYDELGNVREATDFGGLVTGTEADRAGRAVRTFEDTASGNPDVTSETTLDADGRALSAKDRRQVDAASLGATVTVYDALGRTTSVTAASGSSPDIATITATTYDALDRVLTENTGDGTGTAQQTTFTYDLGGRVLSTDDEFSCTARTYDYRDLALTETSGLVGGTCAAGADTRTVTHTHDALGRLTRSEVTAGTGTGDRTLDATLDAAGRTLTAATRTAGVTATTTYTLSALDETLAETRPDGSTAKTTYDPAGNASDRCYWKPGISVGACNAVGTTPWTDPPTSSTTTTYDARNNRLALADGATSTTTVYDPDHNYQPAAFYVPTGSGRELQTLYGYDTQHRLTAITHQLCTISAGHSCASTTATGSDAYAYDDNDNRTQVAEANGSTSSDRRYCYDGLDRLRARNTGAGCTTTSGDETATYDDAGNRLTAPGVSATYDAQGQLATCTGCGTVAHDSAGRITGLAGWTYAYDAQGRLITATETASGDRLEATYDAQGHRTQLREVTAGVLSRTRDLRYVGDAIVEEQVTDAAHPAGAVVRTYTVTEAGQVVSVTIPAGETGAGTYLVTWNGHGDALALWRQETDGALVLANSYTYGTWGSPSTATHNGIPDLGFRFLYVGAADVQWDDFSGAGLLYMHARHYHPLIGRFLQPDPSAAEVNLYGYAGNSPVSKTDPSGLYYRLYRPYLRYAARVMYSRGRISYRSYCRLHSASFVYFRNRTLGQRVTFASSDWCPGGVVGGTVGLVTMGIIDVGVGVANVVAVGAGGVAELAMLPVDAGAFVATIGFYNILEQSTRNGCNKIKWKWPWE